MTRFSDPYRTIVVEPAPARTRPQPAREPAPPEPAKPDPEEPARRPERKPVRR